MKIRKIYIFGNLDIPEDSLPLRILPELRREFPDVDFVTIDPNEEWEVPEELVAIDTAYGVYQVTVFDDLDRFEPAPRISLHDFDALTNLKYLHKLGKLKTLHIVGVPPGFSEEEATESVIAVLRKF